VCKTRNFLRVDDYGVLRNGSSATSNSTGALGNCELLVAMATSFVHQNSKKLLFFGIFSRHADNILVFSFFEKCQATLATAFYFRRPRRHIPGYNPDTVLTYLGVQLFYTAKNHRFLQLPQGDRRQLYVS
jgi:hypothetical protein